MGTRHVAFLDMGDLTAPKGSPRWCLAVREEARSALVSAKTTREHVLRWIGALREEDRFRKLEDREGHRFLTWEAFCSEPPPYGFGMSVEEVEVIIANKPLGQGLAADPAFTRSETKEERDERLAEQSSAAGKAGGKGRSKDNDSQVNSVNKAMGNSAAYLVRRLKRDFPDIAAALARGEYKSARAAGIAAGIVHVPTPPEIARKAWLKMTTKEREAFMEWAGSLNGGEI